MASITGGETNAAIALGGTGTGYGTAVAASTGDKLLFDSLEIKENPTSLDTSTLGSGKSMELDVVRGNISPSVNISGKTYYQGGLDRILAQFFGTAGAPVEQNGGQGDYLHQIGFNDSLNNVFATVAYETSSSTVVEGPSCAFDSITITAENPRSIVTFSATGNANEKELSTSTNTNAVLSGTATIADDEEVILDYDSEFWVNAESGGALSSGDAVNIQSFSLTLNRPQSFKYEVTGSAGLTKPLSDDYFTGTLTVTLRERLDHTWETANLNETAYKCKLGIEGSQIGSGDNKALDIYIPRMKLETDPDYTVSNAGHNPETLTFKLLAATSAPTGFDGTLGEYPYVELLNESSSAYIS